MSAKWLQNLRLALPSRSHIVLTGNVHDEHVLVEFKDEWRRASTSECVWSVLERFGYKFVLQYDPTTGFRLCPGDRMDHLAQALDAEAPSERLIEELNERAHNGLDGLYEIMTTIADSSTTRAGFLLSRASRLVRDSDQLTPDEHRFFTGCECLSLRARQHSVRGVAYYNPVIWLVDSERDLPSWFVVDQEMVAIISVPTPSYPERYSAAEFLADHLDGFDVAGDAERKLVIEEFATLSEGMALRSLVEIVALARAERMPFRELPDAVRWYRIGIPDNPWSEARVFERIKNADEEIGLRVLGQEDAVEKTLDILKRSVTGLSGAQTSAQSNRPRGVLFYAGPTGVGKTEMAKAVTEALFGSQDAYIRFDMSEYSAEHAEARLIGAPPGYVGYEGGGQLTDAVRERPFSVILFDEIEKAHPRLMDKFLQILEDGRLTDGRGQTAYFSEAVIVFTSNLGIVSYDASGQPQADIRASDNLPPKELEARVRSAIERHFRYSLGRPELLNRLGDNIVVFDFIRGEVAEAIFAKALANVGDRVLDQQNLRLELVSEVEEALKRWCTDDLENGGRGIGNRMETGFINPLARALFDERLGERESPHSSGVDEGEPRRVVVETISVDERRPSLQIQIRE